ncbi:MAG TPA: hypothetical protein VLR49_15040, partial [Ferruginibacter sp.]|nr:hypothetical protein [Ferruginibacter sp.]
DKIGRKWIMLIGMLLGVLFYRPIFGELLKSADANEWMKEDTGKKFAEIKDTKNPSIKIDSVSINGSKVEITNTKTVWEMTNGSRFTEISVDTSTSGVVGDDMNLTTISLDKKTVYTDKILSTPLKWKFIGLIWIMIIFVTMVYGPVAAFLVELFPTKIRYTSMSLPYHIGNGVFGGLVPFIATLLSATFTSDPLVGLWYPISVAALCFVIGALYLNNKIDEEVND